jgi:SAM-dependent methyltransferase
MLGRTDSRAHNASLTVHPGDDMYAYGLAIIGFESLTSMAYFRAGASMMNVIERVADWRFGSISKIGSWLDFAAGYGRSTRFLVQYVPPERVTVSEIQSDALEFQAREFRVATLQSTTDPVALRTARQFDFVFVASLFTHLPRRTFGPWLRKLWEMVAPGGVLVFSVHDEALDTLDADWENGFAFVAASEIAALDTEQYGTNFTTASFIRAQLEEWIGKDAADAVRLPRALCFQQDVWVVTRGARNDAPLVYENGPNGALDWMEVDGASFFLTGWVADTGFATIDARNHQITRVDVSITDGTVIDADLGLPRPDVAEHLGRPGDPLLEASGWAARGRGHRRLRLTDIVTVTAVCEHGSRFVLDSTLIQDMLNRTGGTLPPSAVQRRILTAKTVYHHNGVRGLVQLAPTVARNEWRRLGTTLRPRP